MTSPSTRSGPTLGFGVLGLVASFGLLFGVVDGKILTAGTNTELLVAVASAVAGAAMSIVILSDSMDLKRRARHSAKRGAGRSA
jgi:uncharacterized membrane protein YadS